MANIVVFGPHPDDQEIGMGGTIARLAAAGHDVLIADVTDGSPTPRGDRASRLKEAEAALAALQPGPEHAAGRPIRRVLLDLPNRMVEHTLATRHLFAGAIRAQQAQIVFTPWPEDAHPDHRAVTRAVEDARFDAKLTKIAMPTPPGFTSIGPPIYPKWLFYYHVSHLRATVKPDFVLDITGFEVRKVASIRAYRSQFGPWEDVPGPAETGFAKGDPKASLAPPTPAAAPGAAPRGRLVTPDLPERILGYAAYMGSLIGTAYGEPFFTKEPVGLSSLDGLVM
jgi:LmbE family N-acetylglucosaminyl deacetylase